MNGRMLGLIVASVALLAICIVLLLGRARHMAIKYRKARTVTMQRAYSNTRA